MRVGNANEIDMIYGRTDMDSKVNVAGANQEVGNNNINNVDNEKSAVFEMSEATKDMLYRQLEGMENEKEAFENVGKMMEIARRIANGDRVPAADEKALMEFSQEIYQSAKMAGMMKKNRDPEDYDSLVEEDEGSIEDKIRALGDSEAGVSSGETSAAAEAPAQVDAPVSE